MKFERFYTHAPWEKKIGYCRAVKAGNYIHLTGTAPVDEDGSTFAPGNAYLQTKKCIEIISNVLEQMGASLSQTVRTRMFVTDISQWEEYGRAHQEFFSEHPPATSMIEVKGLIDPQMLIEIEADVYVGESS